jgi:hypothetical protein
MGVSLDDEEKGILRYLGKGYDESIDLESIQEYLGDKEYGNFSKKEVIGMLDHLMDTGYVRSKTEGKGDKREEKFYLAKGVGAGVRKRMKLQGRGFFYEPSRLIKRLTGAVFLLIGIGLFVYEGSNATGAVIGSSSGVNPIFFFASILTIIGFLLALNSFKKK